MHVKFGFRRPTQRRHKNEKGATLVLVTLLMVALLGMAAISVDFAIASSDKAKSQNAADAAALAIARECAVRSTKCSSPGGNAEAVWAVSENSPGKTATVSPAPAVANKQVNVRVQGVQQTQFARVLGNNSVSVGAEATASWDQVPVAAVDILPIGIGFCDWKDRAGTVAAPKPAARYSFSTWGSGTSRSCTGVPRFPTQSVKHTKDGLMWFTSGAFPGLDVGSCNFSANLWDVYKDALSTGLLDIHTACDSKFKNLAIGDVVVVPIIGISNWKMPWVGWEFPNSVAVIGFAPMEITGFRKNIFIGFQGPSSTCRFPLSALIFGTGNCTAIEGRFVRTARPIEGWTYSNTFQGQPAEDLGAVKVTLTK